MATTRLRLPAIQAAHQDGPDALSRAFQCALPRTGAVLPASLIGLEHEYRLSKAGAPLDFRGLIHTLPVPGRRLDPGDANAYRLDSGLALTCDDEEAEVATPPLPAGSDFSAALAHWAAFGRDTLTGLMPDGVEASGYSTHLSVAMDDMAAPAVIDLLCATAAPALMLVLETRQSFGVYLRPRPGRIELCGEYVTDGYLQAVAALFTGSVRACHAALRDEVLMRDLPSRLAVLPKQAAGRYGSYLGRRSAFGFDLYEARRDGKLPLAAGGTVSVQDQLGCCWEMAKRYLDPYEPGSEIMEAIVRGELPLRTESREGMGCIGTASASPYLSHPLGGAAKSYRRPHFD